MKTIKYQVNQIYSFSILVLASLTIFTVSFYHYIPSVKAGQSGQFSKGDLYDFIKTLQFPDDSHSLSQFSNELAADISKTYFDFNQRKPVKPTKAGDKVNKVKQKTDDSLFGKIDKSIKSLQNKDRSVNSVNIDRGRFGFSDTLTRKAKSKTAGSSNSDADNAVLHNSGDNLFDDKIVEDRPVVAQSETDNSAAEESLGWDRKLTASFDKEYQDTSVITNKAYNALLNGMNESAVMLYKKAMLNEPDNKFILLGLATAYQKNSQYEQASQIYDRILQIDPRNKHALHNYLDLLTHQKPVIALVELKALYKNNPGFSQLPLQIGSIYFNQENYIEAGKYWMQALMLEPQNTLYLFNLGVVFDKIGNKKEAVRYYRQVLTAARHGKEIPTSALALQNRMVYLINQLPAE